MESLIKKVLSFAWGMAEPYVEKYVNSTETPWDNWGYEAVNDIITKYCSSPDAPAE